MRKLTRIAQFHPASHRRVVVDAPETSRGIGCARRHSVESRASFDRQRRRRCDDANASSTARAYANETHAPDTPCKISFTPAFVFTENRTSVNCKVVCAPCESSLSKSKNDAFFFTRAFSSSMAFVG